MSSISSINRHVLSIQSHVSYGYAGNTAATLPLQLLGFEVSCINTVLYSNSTDYGVFRGEVVNTDTIKSILQGLQDIGQYNIFDAAIVGFIGSKSSLFSSAEAVKTIKNKKSDFLFVCDPVFGDSDKGLFLNSDIADAIKTIAIQDADIITPNHFEFEYICGKKINSIESALVAIEEFNKIKQKQAFIVTSFTRNDAKEHVIEVLCVSPEERFIVSTPIIDNGFTVTGTGDIFSAVVTAKILEGINIKDTILYATNLISDILNNTMKKSRKEMDLIGSISSFAMPTEIATLQDL